MTKKHNHTIVLWLLTGVFLIVLMVIIGGITRLTGSGLSITEWNLILGAIPPLNETDWAESFEKYKQIPQFKLENAHFTLDDYKFIFFWEWLHRFIGRILGVVFVVPYIYFTWKINIPKWLHRKLLVVFLLGGFQGFLGWFMVKSGLSELTSVSHFRLASHLTTAFITCGYLIWIIRDVQAQEKQARSIPKQAVTLGWIFFSLVLLQIIFGAFVAGLDGGFGYNTWPMMNGKWVNTESFAPQKSFLFQLFNQKFGTQIIHRYFAYVVLLAGLVFVSLVPKYTDNPKAIRLARLSFLLIIAQFTLGIVTILFLPSNPVLIGIMHQLGAFFVFCVLILYLHTVSHRTITH